MGSDPSLRRCREMARGLCLAGTHLSRRSRSGKIASANPPQTLADVLEFEKQLDQKIERLYHYASLQLAEDSANTDYLARIGQLQNLLTKISEAFAFVTPEIQAIDDEKFAQFLNDPALSSWKIKLQKDSPDEAACSLRTRGTPARAGRFGDGRIRRRFLAANRCRHEIRRASGRDRAREVPLTQSSFSSFLVKRDHALRKRAFHQFYDEFQGSPIHARLVPRLFGQGRCFSRARAKLFRRRSRPRSFATMCRSAVYDGLIAAVRRQSRAALSLLRSAPARS